MQHCIVHHDFLVHLSDELFGPIGILERPFTMWLAVHNSTLHYYVDSESVPSNSLVLRAYCFPGDNSMTNRQAALTVA